MQWLRLMTHPVTQVLAALVGVVGMGSVGWLALRWWATRTRRREERRRLHARLQHLQQVTAQLNKLKKDLHG